MKVFRGTCADQWCFCRIITRGVQSLAGNDSEPLAEAKPADRF